MVSLLFLPIIALMISPIWFKSPKSTKIQLYLLVATTIYGMVMLTPSRAHNSAPLNKFPKPLIAFFSCSLMISDIQFCSVDSGDENSRRNFRDNSCFCRNENALSTLAFCYHSGYPTEMESFVQMCNRDYNTSLTLEKFDLALDRYYKTAKEIPVNASLLGGVVNYPVKLSPESLSLCRDSYDQFLGNYNRSIDYGWYMVVYWILVFGLAAVGNWSKVLLPKLVNKSTGPVLRWTRSKVTLPALSGKEKTTEKKLWKFLDYLPPTRTETLIIGLFSVIILHTCFYKIKYVPQDTIFSSKLAAYMRYYSVRTGILASSLLPLSILFAGRNNVLQWITRWEYSTFVMFHRWISRVMVLLLVVHSIGYSRHILFPVTHIKTYVLFGILGTVSGLGILIQGLLVLRRRWYEAFLFIHIVLSAAFVVGAYFHVHELDFLWYFYVSACLWVFDRIIRIHRLCVFGFPQAKIQLYEDDTLKVRVPVPAGFHAEGGGHCFLHFLHWSCFWQSHPFTYILVDGNIVFYVKVKEGVTSQLKAYLEHHPSKAAYMRVAVEGSYEEATPAKKYDSSVFIAGGSGIPGIFAEAVEVAKNNKGLRKVTLIWVVREYSSLLWFYEELSSLLHFNIETEVYVTKPEIRLSALVSDKLALLDNTYTHNNYYSVELMEDPIQKLEENLENIKFRKGRPNIGKIVQKAAKESIGSTCYIACGHPIMVDEVRYEVAQKVRYSEKRLDYFEQLQVWA